MSPSADNLVPHLFYLRTVAASPGAPRDARLVLQITSAIRFDANYASTFYSLAPMIIGDRFDYSRLNRLDPDIEDEWAFDQGPWPFDAWLRSLEADALEHIAMAEAAQPPPSLRIEDYSGSRSDLAYMMGGNQTLIDEARNAAREPHPFVLYAERKISRKRAAAGDEPIDLRSITPAIPLTIIPAGSLIRLRSRPSKIVEHLWGFADAERDALTSGAVRAVDGVLEVDPDSMDAVGEWLFFAARKDPFVGPKFARKDVSYFVLRVAPPASRPQTFADLLELAQQSRAVEAWRVIAQSLSSSTTGQPLALAALVAAHAVYDSIEAASSAIDAPINRGGEPSDLPTAALAAARDLARHAKKHIEDAIEGSGNR